MLAGDLGGTKILLELSPAGDHAPSERFAARYSAAGFPGFAQVLGAFLDAHAAAAGAPARIERACFGVAGPVAGGKARLTNLPWNIDAAELAARFGIGSVLLVNDFAAAAAGIDELDAGGLATLQAGSPVERGPRIVVGAGTGFGTASAVWCEGGYRMIPGEGGHAGFAPADELQAALWRDIHGREGRVSIEHVVSGPGLLRIHDFLRRSGAGAESNALRAALDAGAGAEAITAHALQRSDALALASLDLFIACYGAAAGDLALSTLCTGGAYIAGGIAPRILPRLAAGGFLHAFDAKGPQSTLMARMPVHVVTDERLGLLGARRIARQPDAMAAARPGAAP